VCVTPVGTPVLRINTCDVPPFIKKSLLFLFIFVCSFFFLLSKKKEGKEERNRRQNTSVLHLEYSTRLESHSSSSTRSIS